MKGSRILFLTLSILIAGWIWWGNSALEVSTYQVLSHRLPAALDGFRIAQISDLHNAEFDRKNEKLLSVLRQTEPDIIVLTGDLVDSRRTELSVALSFAREAVKIAPCYYVTGNHESRIGQLPVLLEGLRQAGITVLRNESVLVEHKGDSFLLLGVDDPSFRTDYLLGDSGAVLADALNALAKDDTAYTVLLSHRPEYLQLYRQYAIDLVLSGHAHGGQFRIPGIGGIIAPGQGLFPGYDGGIYSVDNTTMVVSRGVGNSIIPFRINNRPEVVVVELNCQEDQI